MSSEKNTAQDKNLRDHVDPSQVNCLNETHEHSLKSILPKGSDSAYLESDADEQLLLNVYFTQRVRLRSIVIQTNEEHIAQGPKIVKLFMNRSSIGFEDVEDASEAQTAQTLQFTEDDVQNGKAIPLRYVRFQNVDSIHIFVASNQEDEETTRIDRIEFFGNLNEGTKDLSGLQREEE
ncbi:DUF1000-domain-containing protein [Sanghuangporus baumii]|uniref:DUF1000-domain-containing protein n=1 Tax=Sanghuangporus baumii TaxID=108892 RepID=A0A9Q5HSB0_SANBA|nr:DUF1000-domain-containing protein [Sanghuangporus baumii]